MEEVWKDIINFETRYQVSSCGRVRSFDFVDSWGRKKRGKFLSPTLDRRGYPRIKFRWRNKKLELTIRIHRLVALHFIPNPNNLPQVDHIDGNKQNNNVENLEWVTNAENSKRAAKLKLRTYKESSEHVNFKGFIKVINPEGQQVDILSGNKDMESKGYDFRLVSACLMGKRHTHRGMKFIRD